MKILPPDPCTLQVEGLAAYSCEDASSAEGSAALVPEVGRVLVLDDDASLREIIWDFLTESGYLVVAVENGREGVREVLDGDFVLVLCDLSMPSMAGDVFYRAVERIRPDLCKRFVFMTGYRDDTKANAFIESIRAFVLQKPFPLKHLLDAVALAEVCDGYRSVMESAPSDLPVSNECRVAESSPACGLHRSQESALGGKVDVIPARPRIAAMPSAEGLKKQVPAIVEDVPFPRARRVSPVLAVAAVAMLVAFAAIAGVRYPRAWDRAMASAEERRVLEAEWSELSARAQQAAQARPGLLAVQKQAKHLAHVRSAAGWAEALRAISTSAGAEIELRGIEARGAEGGCELQIGGVATGPAPRAVADQFHRILRREIERNFPGTVLCKIDMIEDVPMAASALSGIPRVRFALTVKLGGVGLAKAEIGGAK